MFADLSSFRNLLKAYCSCRKNKRLKKSAAEFEFDYEKHLIALESALKTKAYVPQPFSVFVVTEPKIREIFAAQFRDRVIHHLLISYLEPIFEPKFIYDSYANRKEKGTHGAIKRLQKFQRQITKSGNKKAYYLQADVKSFFSSINHAVLYNLISNHVKNPQVLALLKIIIFHDCAANPNKKGQLSLFVRVPPEKSLFYLPKGQGLPIGNLTSQFFANIYLNELDQYVKHVLKCKYYIRYVDDFVILDTSQEKLYELKDAIEKFLKERLCLQLHPDKWEIDKISNGVDALGYVVRPGYVLVRKRVVRTLKRKLGEFKRIDPSELDLEYVLASINSYYAHFCHANSYQLRKHLWQEHFGSLQKYFQPVNGYKYFKLR